MIEQLKCWDDKVKKHQLQGGFSGSASDLGDFGTEVGLPKSASPQMPQAIADATRAFVKFQSSSKDRLPASESTLKETQSSLCHWAVCYPANRRPRSVRDGAIIFIGMFFATPLTKRHIQRIVVA